MRSVALAFLVMALILAGCAGKAAPQPGSAALPPSDHAASQNAAPGQPVPSANEAPGNANQSPAQPPESAPSRMLKGVSLSPLSYSQQDFNGFFSKAAEAGTIVSWAGDWDELGRENGGPSVVAGLAAQKGYTPLIELQFFNQSDGALLRPLDNATEQRYVSEAADFAGRYKPEYLAIGIEVNTLYEKSPADYGEFKSLFSRVYDAVKAESPGTKVFTVFQLERMEGMKGGLFGGVDDANSSEWQLLSDFPKADLVAFTTYPDLVYKEPSGIPPDYYGSIRGHTAKALAFTEVGWHSAASPQGWESSQGEQADFVRLFFNRTSSLGPDFAVWSFLYDQKTIEPFDSMGLYGQDGKAKEAWQAWVDG